MTLKPSRIALLACCVLFAACGTTPENTPDAGGNTDTPDAGGTTETADAGGNTETPDAGGDAPDAGGTTATKAYIRYAFYSSVAPAMRTSMAVALDGTSLAEGLDAALLTTQSAYFLPGSTDKWIELEPGAHTVTYTAAGKRQVCSDLPDDCYDETYEPSPATRTFTAAAGSYWTVVGGYRIEPTDPEGMSYSPEAFLAALEGGPSTTERYVSLFRWPASAFDNADWAISARHNVSEGTITNTTLAPGAGVIVKLPGDPTRLKVSYPGLRGGTITQELDLQAHIGVNDVYPLLWFGGQPMGPMLSTGPGGSFPLVAP